MKEAVILLHALKRTPRSLFPLERSLRKEGYMVYNLSYPSTKHQFEVLLNHHLAPRIHALPLEKYDRVHFVTHSMGGIMLRYFLQEHDFPHTGRVVMLAPPNRGCEIVDNFGHTRWFRWLLGPASLQLGTHPEKSLPLKLGPAPTEIGILVGNKRILPVFKRYLPGENDGIVAVQNCQLEGMSDFKVLPTTHAMILVSKRAIALTKKFLREGKF